LAAFATRRADEAADWCERAAAAEGVTVVRTLGTLADVNYYLRSDLVAARAVLERLPARYRFVHRVVYARWLMTTAEEHWDQALQDLAQLPDAFLSDTSFSGPKALLAGITHRRAGRTEAALVQFREAERLVRERLTGDSENEELRAILALTLAYGGRPAEARNELALIEPLVRTRAANVHRFKVVMPIAQTYGVIGDFPAMAVWLRMQFAEPSQAPLTPASFRYDVRFAGTAEAAEIKALLKEFAGLDQKPKDLPKADAASDKSVAVLAFANRSDDAANEIFSDGISEELINVLGRVPGLTVKGRASSFYFKNSAATAQEKGQKLGATFLVDGSVRKMGNTVRITAQVIRAATDEVVWSSEPLVREAKDVFAVQEEIAGMIAKALSLKLASSARAKRTVNPDAYELVQRGRDLWLQRSDEALAQAMRAYEEAIRIDDNFAEAHAGLADAALVRGWYMALEGARETTRFFELARSAAMRALAIDATLAEPHATLGALNMNEGHFEEAELEFQTAKRMNPSYSYAHHWHAHLFAARGQLDEAVAAMERATQIDPVSLSALVIHALMVSNAGRHEQAVAITDRAMAVRRNAFLPADGTRALSLFMAGRRDEAVAAARVVTATVTTKPRWWIDSAAIYVLRRTGHEAEALAHGERLVAAWPDVDNFRLYVNVAMGRVDEALEILQRSPVTPSLRIYIYYSEVWEDVRRSPKFPETLKKLGWWAHYERGRATKAKMQAADASKK
jgi:TolB-like protein/Tfp pilus assembly protein PilF